MGECLFDVWDDKGHFYRSAKTLKKPAADEDIIKEIDCGDYCYDLQDSGYSIEGYDDERLNDLFKKYSVLSYKPNFLTGALCSNPFYVWDKYKQAIQYQFWEIKQ